jgi:hypothetical protein
VTASASAPNPRPVGTIVTITGSGVGCNNPEYKFWILRPGGVWTMLRDWGAASYDWTAEPKGSYQFSVWARQIGSATAPESYSIIPITTFIPPCVFGGLTADKASPQPLKTAVTFTATPGGCGTYQTEYEFYVYGGGAWTLVQPYSTNNKWTLDYTKMPAYGTYTIDVWIRNVNSGNVYDTYGLMSWVIGGCNYATTSGVGNAFTTTANGVACITPEYKVWMVGKDKPWFVAQEWTTTNVFTINPVTLGLTNLTYTVDVWVRQKDSSTDPNYYETWGLATYVNGTAPCNATAPTLTANPNSPRSTGAGMVNFTATGCGPNAQYSYWIYPGVGGGWQNLRPYAANGGYSWLPAPSFGAGNYSIVVWAKQSGSTTPDYDSYAVYSYELNGCTSAGVTSDKPNPQVRSTAITFTASSVGCANPEYSFWVLPAGGVWTNVQPYSLTSTYLWNSATANNYALVVWVRQQGGPTPSTAFETFAVTSFTLTA